MKSEAAVRTQSKTSMIENNLGRQKGHTSTILWNWEKTAWAALLLLAVFSRFYDLGARVISHDESLHTYYSWQLYRGQGFQHTPMMHGPLQFHALALSYFLFGASDVTARLPAAVFGVMAVGLVWFLRRWLGRSGALAAGVLMTISPSLLYYSRYVRNEAFVVVWALIMAIAMFNYWKARDKRWLYAMAAVLALHHATKEVAFIYDAIWMVFLGLVFVADMDRVQWNRRKLRFVFRGLLVGAAVFAVLTPMFQQWGGDLSAMYMENGAQATVKDAIDIDNESEILPVGVATGNANLGAYISGGMTMIFLVGAFAIAVLGAREEARRLASLDLLVVFGTLVLPQLVAFPVKLLLRSDPLDYSVTGMWTTGPVLLGLMLISVAVGALWEWRKWIVIATIYYGLYIVLFTTVFTNGNGLASGVVGSLGYWLDQQAVERGSQPWYYYMVVVIPMYEYLPALGSLMCAWFGMRKVRSRLSRNRTNAASDGNAPRVTDLGSNSFPAMRFIMVWAVLAILSYSLAGEKMPWLVVHIALPMILLSGWAIGILVERVDWRRIRTSGGAVAVVSLAACVSGVMHIGAQLAWGIGPFQGLEVAELDATMGFLSAATIILAGVVGLRIVARRFGYSGLADVVALCAVGLAIIVTAHTSIFANYINYDNQTEFINYASGAPGIRVVMDQVEEISRRTTDGLDIRVAYDDDVSWPFTWYLRDYRNQIYFGGQPSRETFRDTPLVIAGDSNWARVEPLLANKYQSFEYIRMWWPTQEYFNLTPDRIRGAMGDRRYREALWRIWLWRDYDLYGELTNVDFSLSNWPVVDKMRLYVDRDIATMLWSLGLEPAESEVAAVPEEFEQNWRSVAAEVMWGKHGSGGGELEQPRGVAIGPEGFVYVADTFNHRVQKFDPNGKSVTEWGVYGSPGSEDAGAIVLNEPWGIAVSSDRYVYVADTWNHRIQKFTSEGEFVTSWGGFGDGSDMLSMWGPRSVAIGPKGRVYVADTGNKRISVFDDDGNPLLTIGSGGSRDGEIDEPVGVAVSSNGEVYIADTWNQRVQVFGSDGAYLRQWDVFGWFGQSLDNKPYLALDHRNNVYISDPEGYRILVSDSEGNPLMSWGDYGAADDGFILPAGIALSTRGDVYVVDSGNHRIMKFAVEGLWGLRE